MNETKKAFHLLFVGLAACVAIGIFSYAVLLPALPAIDQDKYPEMMHQRGY
jgi:flagellar biosynthesis protein FliR